jgi:putative transposase
VAIKAGTCAAQKRSRRTLNQAAPLRALPDGVTDLDHFRVRRRDRAGGVIHEYRLAA